MKRRRMTVAVVLTVLGLGASEADAAVPRQTALDAYSGLWHKCKKASRCEPGRNVRREGIRFKWVSPEDKSLRHWGERPATAAEVASGIRRLRVRFDNPPGFVIPWPIVQCESRGTNQPPNSASASGYYQIIHSTWVRMGGLRYASAAYLATKRQQDKIAARIWAVGGAGQWDCSRLV